MLYFSMPLDNCLTFYSNLNCNSLHYKLNININLKTNKSILMYCINFSINNSPFI